MDFNKSSKLLKKFKGLHNTLRDSGQEPSSIEKDLLLSYLKELYEQVMSIGEDAAQPAVTRKAEIETITASSNGHAQVYEAPKQVVAPAPIVTAPVVEQVVVQEPVVAVPEVVATPTPVPTPQPATANNMVDSSLLTLFSDKGVNELSDKLNKLPITDINRAMGINEKVLTINELFDGNQELFSKTVLKLNSFVSFEEAKNYLIGGVASDLKWGEDSKFKKADKFIQLLRRRYS